MVFEHKECESAHDALHTSNENFFTRGRRDDEGITVQPRAEQLDVIAWKFYGRRLVLLFNFGREAVEVQVSVKSDKSIPIADAETLQLLGSAPLQLELKPNDVRALLMPLSGDQ